MNDLTRLEINKGVERDIAEVANLIASLRDENDNGKKGNHFSPGYCLEKLSIAKDVLDRVEAKLCRYI